MSKRSQEVQLWAHKQFSARLELLKAEMLMAGKKVRSKGDLTRLIIQTEGWKQVEEEIKQDKKMGGLRFDGLI